MRWTSSRTRVKLAALSGVMLGLAFPPIPAGILAAFAFVPLFIMFESIEEFGKAIRYSYLTFLVFNMTTLYWTGGYVHAKDWYMMVAGTMLLLAHPLFFLLPIAGWWMFRRQFGFRVSLYVFPFIWVTFEYVHSLTQLAFPWLTLGNSQTYSLPLIQIASITGVYGISFWLLCLNVLVYILYTNIGTGKWRSLSRPSMAFALFILVLYSLPGMYGLMAISRVGGTAGSARKPIRISVIQPDIDPFEKWQGQADRQIELLRVMTAMASKDRADLTLWPETAIPVYVLQGYNSLIFEELQELVDTLRTNLLTGVPDILYYTDGQKIPRSSRVSRTGQHYDSFNSSMLVQPGSDRVQKYAKTILVPFAERVPYSEELSFLNAMEWNFGLGGWCIGKDTTLFRCWRRDSTELLKFSNLICFESVYPSFVRNFVRKGAEFLTVITNDSWWGNTSGAYQHEQFTVLRAVENRRWVVVCGNGGISCVIDPVGRIVESTSLYARTAMVANIEPRTDETPFTRYGDWFAEGCSILCGFFLCSAIGMGMYQKMRMKQSDEIH